MESSIPWLGNEDFDIDVDISSYLDRVEEPVLISDRFYRLAHAKGLRDPQLREKAERMWQNAMLCAQWMARSRGTLDRRRSIRVPMISRVMLENGQHMTSTDISLSGMRCSGQPHSPVMNVEFKVPGLPFPVDARVELMTYKESPVIPLVGLRFINLERAYTDHIAQYIAGRRERLLRAA